MHCILALLLVTLFISIGMIKMTYVTRSVKKALSAGCTKVPFPSTCHIYSPSSKPTKGQISFWLDRSQYLGFTWASGRVSGRARTGCPNWENPSDRTVIGIQFILIPIITILVLIFRLYRFILIWEQWLKYAWK